jgi:hypothetical protein
MRSAGVYVFPHTSQTSPYWSFDLQLGHVPRTKRSGRNRRSTSQYVCSTERRAMSPASFSRP